MLQFQFHQSLSTAMVLFCVKYSLSQMTFETPGNGIKFHTNAFSIKYFLFFNITVSFKAEWSSTLLHVHVTYYWTYQWQGLAIKTATEVNLQQKLLFRWTKMYFKHYSKKEIILSLKFSVFIFSELPIIGLFL